MDTLLAPFAGLLPVAEHAAQVIAPPYDVLSTEEARQAARGNPWSFLHVSKAEIDLPAGTDPFAPAVYAKAGENFRRMIADGVLRRDARPAFYAYRIEAGGHVQTGVAGAGSIAAYRANRIRRHELTRPDKEDDRVRQIEAVDAQTGPVFVVHRRDAAVAALLQRATQRNPALAAPGPGGSHHTLWAIGDAADIAALTDAFDKMPALYIADGHHRAAAGARVAASRPGSAAAQRLLVVSFPDDEVRILDYNRVVRDLNGLSEAAFREAVARRFTVTEAGSPVRPEATGVFGMYLAGRWYRLAAREPVPADAPPAERLDVSLLANRLLAPILGIADPRTDERIDFVGGARGTAELARRVDSGEMAVAFALHPTRLDQLFAVADAGEIMPPKSTWFEPKLADGMVSYPLW